MWVVTREPSGAAIARGLGAEPVTEAENRGHTAAVALAQAEAARRGARVFLTVPGDVPRVTAEELRRLAGAPGGGAPGVAPPPPGLGPPRGAPAPPPALAPPARGPPFPPHPPHAADGGL